jgi:transposase
VQALNPRVVDAVWAAIEALLPPWPPDTHPLGCHRGRISDRDCFTGILLRLVTGCSWDVAARLTVPGETTLRGRRTSWLLAGVFDRLATEALAGYDRIIGLDLDEVAVDGSLHKAPCGGPGTGPNPTDRAKLGWKWSIATDTVGIPIGWVTDAANRNDSILLEPTLRAVARRGLLPDIATLHLDKGYDSTITLTRCANLGLTDIVCAKKKTTTNPTTNTSKPKNNTPTTTKTTTHTMGQRWPVERTNSWLTNYGQLRRNTDRHPEQRLGQIDLAIALILTVKLVNWAKRWND